MKKSDTKNSILLSLLIGFTFVFCLQTVAQMDCQEIDTMYTGECIVYDEDGNLINKKVYENGALKQKLYFDKNGNKAILNIEDAEDNSFHFKYYYGENLVIQEMDVVKGSGTFKEYYGDGTLHYEGKIRNEVCVGPWFAYDKKGNKRVELRDTEMEQGQGRNFDMLSYACYKNKLILEKYLTKATDEQATEIIVIGEDVDDIARPVPAPIGPPPAVRGSVKRNDIIESPDVEATYVGGPGKLREFIFATIIYPEAALKHYEQGKVYLSFIVEKDGSISDIKIERAVSPSLDKEAKRVVSVMPKWEPATLDGKPVASRVNLPVVFVITD